MPVPSVRLFVCLFFCLLLCPSARLSVRLPVCLSVCPFVCSFVCLSARLSVRLPASLLVLSLFKSVCLSAYLSLCRRWVLERPPSHGMHRYYAPPHIYPFQPGGPHERPQLRGCGLFDRVGCNGCDGRILIGLPPRWGSRFPSRPQPPPAQPSLTSFRLRCLTSPHLTSPHFTSLSHPFPCLPFAPFALLLLCLAPISALPVHVQEKQWRRWMCCSLAWGRWLAGVRGCQPLSIAFCPILQCPM